MQQTTQGVFNNSKKGRTMGNGTERKTRKKRRKAAVIVLGICGAAAVSAGVFLRTFPGFYEKPEELLVHYMECIEQKDYKGMYAMLSDESRTAYTEEAFILRNQNIYEGIETSEVSTEVLEIKKHKSQVTVSYQQTIKGVAGEFFFENEAAFVKEKGYALRWDDHVIFPGLEKEDKVQVSVQEAARGEIQDRNGVVLAGQGLSTSVGLVPGKMREDTAGDLEKMAGLLGTSADAIQTRLDAKWVREDTFVPIATLPKISELDTLTYEPEEETQQNQALQDALLEIPGVMLSDVETRIYPLNKSASHLTGYVQKVTAEDLEKHEGEGYGTNSVIGRSGIESLYEKELKGRDGYEIEIIDQDGNKKETLAFSAKEDGKNIQLTIDAELQQSLYEEFREEKSCSVAMNPYTGEVLALVSTPSFDSNDFIRGFSEARWSELNEDKSTPLVNRYRQTLVPGSSFKPITAAIGLAAGAIDPNEDYGSEGTSWQKDKSWGDYFVTTLHACEPATLENALICSDNIYFAKAALRIGAQPLQEALDKLGFGREIPFEIPMGISQYSNSKEIDSEVMLADSGYGQGQILVNPLHLAVLYTAFVNDGSVVKPYLQYRETPEAEYWIPGAFTPEIAEQVKKGMEKVINTPEGTGYAAHRENVVLAGKTGTAEIKVSKEDSGGTELGWFGVFTADPNEKKPLLLLNMTEDVKDRGGSGCVVEHVNHMLEQYFSEQ